MKDTFSFKKFNVAQDQCAMKVGTDGVLLGAWLRPISGTGKLLDIGSGTGLIALMLAQRCPEANITGIEIDPLAAKQANENVANSSFKKQVDIIPISLQEYAPMHAFQLIVSNPPFYIPNAQMESSSRKKARHTTQLGFPELLENTRRLLDHKGSCNFIIPFDRELEFLKLATVLGFFPSRITRVRGRKQAPIKRSLIELKLVKCPLEEDELCIEIERHQYTKEYQELVSPFYLKM